MLVTLVSILGMSLVARADYIVFDNGEPTVDTGGNDIWGWLQADNFVLAENTILTGAHFWTHERDDRIWDGTLEYFIFADNGGIPGTIINSGDGQNIQKNTIGEKQVSKYY